MDGENFEDIERKIKRYNQGHLLEYYNNIQDANVKLKFEDQLENIDFELIDSLYKKTTLPVKNENVDIEPIDYWDKERLGGKYDFYEEIHKSLFELLCDGLKESGKKYGVEIPWFIMTSEENNEETKEFFRKNKFFGYEKNIHFFVQGQLPMVDTEGKILIGENGLIKEAADGHGGVYESLVKSKMVDKMKELGVLMVMVEFMNH